jgi:hypothetical protein
MGTLPEKSRLKPGLLLRAGMTAQETRECKCKAQNYWRYNLLIRWHVGRSPSAFAGKLPDLGSSWREELLPKPPSNALGPRENTLRHTQALLLLNIGLSWHFV